VSAPEEGRPPRALSPWAWWLAGLAVTAALASGIMVARGQREHGCFVLTLTFVLCATAAWLDVATRRIPNVLTYPAILLGLFLNLGAPFLLRWLGADTALTWLGGPHPLDAGFGFAVAAGIGIVSFLCRGLGGGDVKLLGAMGALLGLWSFLPVFFNAIAIAAVIGLTNWAFKGTLVPRLQVLAGNLFAAVVTGESLKGVYPFGRSESPFGLALLLGLALAPFAQVHALFWGLLT